MLVSQLYQNRFEVQQHKWQKAQGTRDHAASGNETTMEKLNHSKYQQAPNSH